MKKTIALTLIILFLLMNVDLLAQGCPMCKTSIDAARKGGSQIGETLNNGILYLLALPYIVVSVFGVIWYKSHKASKKSSPQL